MAKRDIIVIGASAGGVETLLRFIGTLPCDFAVPIFIVLHLSPFSESNLPAIITRASALTATHPKDGEQIKPGHIYIAPPDYHLLIERGNTVGVKKGPKENRFRPSIDALFLSAALIYGPRVIGVVLSGLLDDGTSGMWNIQRCGGFTIVQDPADALYPSMPNNVLQYVEVDQMLPASDIGPVLVKMAGKKAPKRPELTRQQMKLLKMEVVIASHDTAFELGILDMGKLTTFACPECKGALISLKEGEMVRFRCHTGHAYTASTLLAGVSTQVEEKLWQAMQGLEATSMLLEQISHHYKTVGNHKAAIEFKKKAEEMTRRSKIIHDSIFIQDLLSEDKRLDV